MVVPGHARRALASHQPCPYAIVADTPLQNRSASDGSAPHFGWRFGSPPGVPGGGITGVRPPPTGGTAIPGSTPAGGHITPLDSESCSLSGRFPVVSFERGATLPRPGEQFRFDGDDEGGGSERFDCACAVVVASSAAAARATAMVELRIGNLRGVSVCNVNVRRRRSFRREPSPPVRAPRTCARAVQPGRERPGAGARFVIEGRLTVRCRCSQICGRHDFLRKLQWQKRYLGSGLQMSPSTATPLTWHRACSL